MGDRASESNLEKLITFLQERGLYIVVVTLVRMIRAIIQLSSPFEVGGLIVSK